MCSGADFIFEVSFTTANGSGSYDVIDATNANTILASGSISPIVVTLVSNSSTTPFDINVWDQNDNTCIGSQVEITPLNCACPSSLNLSGNETGIADFESSGPITSEQIIESTAIVDYDSALEINLNFPFEIELGAEFEAFIDGCNNGGGGLNATVESVLIDK
jgi:hypothetical protein